MVSLSSPMAFSTCLKEARCWIARWARSTKIWFVRLPSVSPTFKQRTCSRPTIYQSLSVASLSSVNLLSNTTEMHLVGWAIAWAASRKLSKETLSKGTRSVISTCLSRQQTCETSTPTFKRCSLCSTSTTRCSKKTSSLTDTETCQATQICMTSGASLSRSIQFLSWLLLIAMTHCNLCTASPSSQRSSKSCKSWRRERNWMALQSSDIRATLRQCSMPWKSEPIQRSPRVFLTTRKVDPQCFQFSRELSSVLTPLASESSSGVNRSFRLRFTLLLCQHLDLKSYSQLVKIRLVPARLSTKRSSLATAHLTTCEEPCSTISVKLWKEAKFAQGGCQSSTLDSAL